MQFSALNGTMRATPWEMWGNENEVTTHPLRIEGFDTADSATVKVTLSVVTASPGTVTLDDFNRSDGALGSSWSSPVISGQNAPVIESNAVHRNFSGGTTSEQTAYWNASMYPVDTDMQMTIRTLSLTYDDEAWYFVTGFNGNPASFTGYIWNFYSVAGNYRMELYRASAGSFTTIDTSHTHTLTAGDVLRVSKVGTAMKFYVNGVLAASYVDSTPLTADGYIGFGIRERTAENLHVYGLDDFSVVSPTGGVAETAQFADTATVTVVLQASGTDTLTGSTIYTDAATVGVVLATSAVENVQDVDSATVLVDLQTSGTDLREVTDTGTVLVDLSTSGTDLREVTDAATTPLLIGVAGVDAWQAVETATVLVDVQTSGTDLREVTDTGTVYVDVQPNTDDTAQFVDSATASVLLGVSGVDTGQPVDATTVALDLSCSGSDVLTAVDTATPVVVITATNLDTAQYVEAGTTTVVIGVSGTDQQTGAVVDYIDSATVLVDLTCSAVENVQAVESNTVLVDITTSSTDAPVYAEALIIPVALFASGTDAWVRVFGDTATVPLTLAVSALEQQISALQPDLLLVGTVAQRWMTQFIGLRWKTSSDILRWNGKLERQRMQPLNAVKAWKSEG